MQSIVAKGQGSTIQVMVGALIVAILSLFLFITQTSSTAETLQNVGRTSETFSSRATLLNLKTLTVASERSDNPTVGKLISYTCEYSEDGTIQPVGQQDYSSESYDAEEEFDTFAYAENYLDTAITGNYHLKVDCGIENGEERIFYVNDPPPEEATVLASQLSIPKAESGMAEVFLYRWR